jgi:hypothetical protein
MERSEPSIPPGGGPGIVTREERAPSAMADDLAAREARVRFRGEGMPALEPDERIEPLLDLGERVLAVHRAVQLDRRAPRPGSPGPAGVPGDLYLTSRRLVLIGRPTLSFELAGIEDAVISGPRLLMGLHDGHGVAVGTAQPRLMWTEIAAARASAKAARPEARGETPQLASR